MIYIIDHQDLYLLGMLYINFQNLIKFIVQIIMRLMKKELINLIR